MESIVVSNLENEQVIRAEGTIDFTNSNRFVTALSRAVLDSERVKVDLSLVDIIDSTAIIGLTKSLRQASSYDGRLSIAGVSSNVSKILWMSGLGGMLGVKSVEHASDTKVKPDLRRQDWRIGETMVIAEWQMLEYLRDFAVSSACDARLDEVSVIDVQLAVAEALTNAFHYGSPIKGKNKIGVQCMSCAKAFVIEVTDEGIGVSADTLQRANESRDESGVGLRLIQGAMDDVQFLPKETGGMVRMVKWIRQ